MGTVAPKEEGIGGRLAVLIMRLTTAWGGMGLCRVAPKGRATTSAPSATPKGEFVAYQAANSPSLPTSGDVTEDSQTSEGALDEVIAPKCCDL